MDEMPLKGLKYLSQSTDSLHKTSKVNESTESLTDEGKVVSWRVITVTEPVFAVLSL